MSSRGLPASTTKSCTGPNAGRYSVNIFLQASNLLNTVNWQNYSGVMTSSNFGKPSSASAARSVTMGVRFGF